MFLKYTQKDLLLKLPLLLCIYQISAKYKFKSNHWEVLEVFKDCTIQFALPRSQIYDPAPPDYSKKFTSFYYEFLLKCQFFRNCISIHTSSLLLYANTSDKMAAALDEKEKELRIIHQTYMKSRLKQKFLYICKVWLPNVFKHKNGYMKLNHVDNNWFISSDLLVERTARYHIISVAEDYILIPYTYSAQKARMIMPVNLAVTIVLVLKPSQMLNTGCQIHGNMKMYEEEDIRLFPFFREFAVINIMFAPIFKFPSNAAIIRHTCDSINVQIYNSKAYNKIYISKSVYEDQCSADISDYVNACMKKTILNHYNISTFVDGYPIIYGYGNFLISRTRKYTPFGGNIRNGGLKYFVLARKENFATQSFDQLASLFTPFTAETWIILVCTLSGIFILTCAIVHIHRLDTLIMYIATLLEQGIDIRTKICRSPKIFLTCMITWIFLCFLLRQLYTSSLYSDITALHSPLSLPKSLQDLVKQNDSLRLLMTPCSFKIFNKINENYLGYHGYFPETDSVVQLFEKIFCKTLNLKEDFFDWWQNGTQTVHLIRFVNCEEYKFLNSIFLEQTENFVVTVYSCSYVVIHRW